MKFIVAGNYTRFAVTLTQKSGELIMPYIPTEGDVVQISLYGARRFDYPNYEQAQNVLTFEDNGCLNVGLYCLEVKITEANTHKLRCMYREQIRVVASNDDVPTDASFTDDDVQLSGQFDIVASTEIVVDDELSLTSTNPVQNKVVTAALNTKGDALASQQTAAGYEVALKQGNTELSAIYIPFADAQDSGLMTSSDYTKLAGIETGANKTVVDDALSTTSENPVQNKVAAAALNTKYDNISVSLDSSGWDVTFNANGVSVYELFIGRATETTAGLFLPSEKAKLDALPTNYDLQTALNAKGGTLAGGLSAAGYEIELKSGNATLSAVYVPYADAQADGLMSASDYAKLDALPTNADLTTALNGKQATLTWDTVPTQGSNNPVTSGGLYVVLGDIESILDNINGD